MFMFCLILVFILRLCHGENCGDIRVYHETDDGGPLDEYTECVNNELYFRWEPKELEYNNPNDHNGSKPVITEGMKNYISYTSTVDESPELTAVTMTFGLTKGNYNFNFPYEVNCGNNNLVVISEGINSMEYFKDHDQLIFNGMLVDEIECIFNWETNYLVSTGVNNNLPVFSEFINGFFNELVVYGESYNEVHDTTVDMSIRIDYFLKESDNIYTKHNKHTVQNSDQVIGLGIMSGYILVDSDAEDTCGFGEVSQVDGCFPVLEWFIIGGLIAMFVILFAVNISCKNVTKRKINDNKTKASLSNDKRYIQTSNNSLEATKMEYYKSVGRDKDTGKPVDPRKNPNVIMASKAIEKANNETNCRILEAIVSVNTKDTATINKDAQKDKIEYQMELLKNRSFNNNDNGNKIEHDNDTSKFQDNLLN